MSNFISKNFLFINEKRKEYDKSEIVPQLTLSFLVCGTKKIRFSNQNVTAQAGDIALIRKNELFQSLKMLSKDDLKYKSISIFFTPELIKRYAVMNNVKLQDRYRGNSYIDISQSKFIKAYFDSLLPYFNQPEKLTDNIATLKTMEAIELLLDYDKSLVELIFDLSEPHKINLESYMNQNFCFNIPINEFARLTGRSLSTFKRDFKECFNTTPEKWLKEKRLSEALHLIQYENQKPSDVYSLVGFENYSHFSTSFKKKFGYNASSINK